MSRASFHFIESALRRQHRWILAFAVISTWVGQVLATEMTTNPPVASAITGQSRKSIDLDREREFWSFRKPVRTARPVVNRRDWPRQPLDEYVLQRLEQHQSTPASEASRSTLLRRLTLDLTGLPPTPGEMTSFLEDSHPDAYERAVERCLSSERFGEHLASLWLPLARYAEDQAHQVGDDTTYFYPNAWKYRQWVIRAFNRDLPYDLFLMFQLAADQMSAAADEDLAALGFLGLGPKYYDRGRLAVMAEEWEDRVDTTCRSMLGLTVACARCHDHKFEPISTADYHALAGVFASSRMVSMTPSGYIEKDGTPSAKMQPESVHMVIEGKIQDLPVFIRGNVENKGPVAPRGFLKILSDGGSSEFQGGSGRKELARAIASRENPLTARVMMNRLWGKFFGKPLVDTASNFGHSGNPPVHPELLDDLAIRFMDRGWSVKAMVREMVLSATYRQSSLGTRAGTASGSHGMPSPMPRRRLSVEQWRDSVLFASGTLRPGTGRSMNLDHTNNHFRTVYGFISRLKLDDLLMQFDYPDANVHAEKRSVTTTAIQKLFLLNSAFMTEQGRRLDERARREAGPDAAGRIERLHQIVYGRLPDPDERALARSFIEKPSTGTMTRSEQYAQLLLASNEAMYVD